MTQDSVFMGGEGDSWFLRNKSTLTNEERVAHDPVLKLLDLTGLVPEDVLEVGASNGWRLHALHTRYNCRVTAIEPSQEAIQDGQTRYPAVRFLRGITSSIPIESDCQFNLIIVNFVLHWVDRSTLLRSVAEIDRVLKDGGYLIVGDFYPSQPEKVSYHHMPEGNVWTYKQNYVEILVASNLYDFLAFFTYEAGTHKMKLDVESGNRCFVGLLRKMLNSQYKTTFFRR